MLHELSDSNLLHYYELLKKANKRAIDKKIKGYDSKYLVHLIRLILECEQILTEGDLDLERNKEQLKSIRRGEWSKGQIKDYFSLKEKHLEELYSKSVLPHSPDERKIKQLLINCLEQHFGSLDKAIVKQTDVNDLINEMETLIKRYKQ